MNCPYCVSLITKEQRKKPRLVIGRSAARLVTAPVPERTGRPSILSDYQSIK